MRKVYIDLDYMLIGFFGGLTFGLWLKNRKK